jgi:inosine-uridine nucleoside N-ribohydrolase
MMMKNKLLPLILSLALCMSLLTGCGGSAQSGAPADAAAESVSSATESAGSSESSAGSNEAEASSTEAEASASVIPQESKTESGAVPKVIFDTDIAYINDDAIAMFMLTQADGAGMLDLLGVTTVGGNVFVPEATTAALRQLELIGRTDIPVYQGTDEPLDGFRDMGKESRLYGVPYYCGAYWDFGTDDFADLSQRSPDYLHLKEEPMHGYAKTPAQEETAWDFMIRQVHENPGEVTIMAVGAATNVATALQQDPTIVDDAAGIIYMGGDIDQPGNATPAAEMNRFYDPEAIRQCLAADWKSQLVVPDDLAHQIHLTPSIYERLAAQKKNPVTELILDNQRSFDSEGSDFVWDVVVPAVFLKPELMTQVEDRYVTVDSTPGLNSGRAVTWKAHMHNNMETGEGFPEGIQRAKVLLAIDEDAFWDFYVELLSMDVPSAP